MLRCLSLAAALALFAIACAEAQSLEALPWKTEDGIEVREVPLQGGVFLRQERRDGRVTTLEVDRSSQPPAMCLWRWFNDIKWSFEFCERTNSEWYGEVTAGLGKLEAFIIKNGIHGETRDTLAAQASEYAANNFDGADRMSPIKKRETCRLIVDVGFIGSFNQSGRDKFRSEIDAWVSIPRPPVMEPPCF